MEALAHPHRLGIVAARVNQEDGVVGWVEAGIGNVGGAGPTAERRQRGLAEAQAGIEIADLQPSSMSTASLAGDHNFQWGAFRDTQ
jgi:hypothetical protein